MDGWKEGRRKEGKGIYRGKGREERKDLARSGGREKAAERELRERKRREKWKGVMDEWMDGSWQIC